MAEKAVNLSIPLSIVSRLPVVDSYIISVDLVIPGEEKWVNC